MVPPPGGSRIVPTGNRGPPHSGCRSHSADLPCFLHFLHLLSSLSLFFLLLFFFSIFSNLSQTSVPASLSQQEQTAHLLSTVILSANTSRFFTANQITVHAEGPLVRGRCVSELGGVGWGGGREGLSMWAG